MGRSSAARITAPIRLGLEIRRRRHDLGLSLRELALKAKTDKGQLSKIENGLMEPPLPKLRGIAKALGTSAGTILSCCDERAV